MGKASRAKKEQRQSMEGKPGWQKEASRQEKAIRRKEIEMHNAAVAANPFAGFSLSLDQVAVAMDGQLYKGKKEIHSLCASMAQEAIERDLPETLDAMASLCPIVQTSFWDVKIEVVALDESGVTDNYDPLQAAFLLDKQKCFEWLVIHALETVEGSAVLSRLFSEMLPLADGMDQSMIRYQSTKLMMRKICQCCISNADAETLAKLDKLSTLSDMVANELRMVIGERDSRLERAEIEKSTAKSGNVLEVEPNPEAIRLADEAVEAAKASPDVSQRHSTARNAVRI
jgi:hypothetical protein